MRKQKENKQKGITLIALIITIIVMLILVGVSVSVALNGGLFKTAKQAAEQTKLAVQEESSLKYEYEIAKATGEFTGIYKDYLLYKEYKENGSVGTFEDYVINKYSLGTATNTENYGKEVVGYKSKGEGLDTLVWRLFYQDEKNVYLISETADGDAPVNDITFCEVDEMDQITSYSDILSKYGSGIDISPQGKALMPSIGKAFTTQNTGLAYLAVAYLCDVSVWEPYTDEGGVASYAIGAPTLELFADSYNSTHTDDQKIEITFRDDCYDYSSGVEYFNQESEDNIYIPNSNTALFLASPGSYSDTEIYILWPGDRILDS